MSLNGTGSVMTFEPLSASQRTGAIVVAVFALLSALALAFIALRTIRLATVVFLQRDDGTSRPPEILFFRTQLGHYGGCLILSNMFISAAGLIDFSWASRSGLSRGSTCSSQAVLMQIGIWSTCWFTAALGVHNLSSFVFHIRQARWRSLAAVTIGWTVAFVAGLAPLQKSKVYGPTGSSCGITRSYPDIFALEALPIILAAFVSTTVYSVIFIVLHGELSMNSIQKLRGPNSTNQRGEDRFEEYHRFIRTIIWTMFWFPLAFVLLLLPFCITHILMYAGYSVPSASSVFADVCVSMLGFVNVCLLCNTLRVISPVHRGPRSDKVVAETVKTFGNDASGESPIIPRNKFFSQPTILSHENSHRMYTPTQPSPNHSRDSSWASVNSNTELLSAKKASYESVQAKVAPLPLSGISPPPELSRQLGGDAPLRTASLDLRSRRVSFVTRHTRPEPSTQDQQCSADTHAPRKGAKEPTFKSKAPPALNFSRLLVLPHPVPSRDVTSKSSTLAARLGVPVASACTPSQTSVVFSAQRPDQGNASVSAHLATPIPRIEVNTWSPENADESNSRPSLSPSSLCTDSDSDYSGEIMYIRKVRPLPQVPEPCDNEQDTVDLCPPSPPCIRARSQRTTMTSVWSQESGYTMSQPPNAESQEAYQQLVANMLAPGVMLGDQADVGRVMSRQTPSGPRARPKTLKVVSTLSARFTQMLSPKSPNNRCPTIVFAPNDSIV